MQTRPWAVSHALHCLWLHFSGKDNPADLHTRRISLDALTTNSKWWNGSSFLRQTDFLTKGLDEEIPKRVYLTEMKKNSNPNGDISSKSLIFQTMQN
ncbi:hypothetical protein TNCV_379071 [Trichonephila clavipes]|nr:hypothetical protein TNCV_379071 [Trichonephila clavipes]